MFRVEETWAFRFPRREAALPCVERELVVLPILAPLVPFVVPFPEFVGRATPPYPHPFWGSRIIEGRELALAALGDGELLTCAKTLGTALRALHGLELPETLHDALPSDPNRRGDPLERSRQLLPLIPRLAGSLPKETADALTALAEEEAATILPHTPTVILHGDLHLRHVLVTDHGSLAGIIDWGDTCRGPRSIDLSIAYSAFPREARDAFFTAYGDVPEAAEKCHALTLAAHLAALLLDTAQARDDAEQLKAQRAALIRIGTAYRER